MTRCVHRQLVLLALFTSGCRTQIQHGLEERDANEIISALVSRGFDARKVAEKGKKPTWAIELDDEHSTDSLRILTELKLPRPPRTTTREVTSQVGLIETPAAERLRQMEALEGDIEQMLEGMDGVASAGVELVVPPPSRPGQIPVASKASALLRVHPTSLERLQQQREPIRALIAGSVEGLKADDVVVMLDPVTSQVSSPSPPEQSADRFRWVIVFIGALLTSVAGALVAIALRLRRNARVVGVSPEPAAPIVATMRARVLPPAQRPIVNPNIQRRVA